MKTLANIIMIVVVFVFVALMMGSVMGLSSLAVTLSDGMFSIVWIGASGLITSILAYFMFKAEQE